MVLRLYTLCNLCFNRNTIWHTVHKEISADRTITQYRQEIVADKWFVLLNYNRVVVNCSHEANLRACTQGQRSCYLNLFSCFFSHNHLNTFI